MRTGTKIIISLVAIALIATVSMSSTASYGDIACEQGWLIPGVLPLYICYNPDGGMDHSFLTYEAMNAYYVPPDTETYIPPVTYIYGAPTETLTP